MYCTYYFGMCVLHVCLCVCMCMWRSEDNLGFVPWEVSVLFFFCRQCFSLAWSVLSSLACEPWEHSSCRLWSTSLQMCATSLHVFLGLELRFSRLSGKLYTSWPVSSGSSLWILVWVFSVGSYSSLLTVSRMVFNLLWMFEWILASRGMWLTWTTSLCTSMLWRPAVMTSS